MPLTCIQYGEERQNTYCCVLDPNSVV